jgi:hypothetical protein
MRRVLCLRRMALWLAVAFLAAPSSEASSVYPAEIQKQLGLSYLPNCDICHANGVTGFGTVTTPFGEAMRARGLVCCDIASLDTALAALKGEMSPYITYLQEGLDPNNPSAGPVPSATYGCFNVTGQGRLGATGAFLLVVALLLLRPRRHEAL